MHDCAGRDSGSRIGRSSSVRRPVRFVGTRAAFLSSTTMVVPRVRALSRRRSPAARPCRGHSVASRSTAVSRHAGESRASVAVHAAANGESQLDRAITGEAQTRAGVLVRPPLVVPRRTLPRRSGEESRTELPPHRLRTGGAGSAAVLEGESRDFREARGPDPSLSVEAVVLHTLRTDLPCGRAAPRQQ